MAISIYDQARIAAAQQAQGYGSDGRSVLTDQYLASIFNPLSGLAATDPYWGVTDTHHSDSGDANIYGMFGAQYTTADGLTLAGGLENYLPANAYRAFQAPPGTSTWVGDHGYGYMHTTQPTAEEYQAAYAQYQRDLATQFGLDPNMQYASYYGQNPTGNDRSDYARVLYQIGPDGNAAPITAYNSYQGSDWSGALQGLAFVGGGILGGLGLQAALGGAAAGAAGGSGAITGGSGLVAGGASGAGLTATAAGSGYGLAAATGTGAGLAAGTGSGIIGAGIGGSLAGLGGSMGFFDTLGSMIGKAGSVMGSQAGAGMSWGQLLSAGLGLYQANQAQSAQNDVLNRMMNSSDQQFQLALDQWNFAKNTYLPEAMKRDAEAFELTKKLADQQYDNANYYRDIAGQSFDQAKKSWEFQDRYMDMARDYDSGAMGNTMAGQANADVEQAYGAGLGQMGRLAGRMGLNPSSGAFASTLGDLYNEKMLASAGAQTGAYQLARQKAEQMVATAAGAGQAGFGTGVQAGGLGNNSANSAGALANSGVNSIGQVANTFSGGLGAAGNMFGSNVNNWNAVAGLAGKSPMLDFTTGLLNGWNKQQAAGG